ncbi:MAG: 2OG-Fe(II) oxygenase [Cyanobium sp.]
MKLIGEYHDSGYLALADAVRAFFERRSDLQRPGVSFGASPAGGDAAAAAGGEAEPDKVSTDISLVWLDRSDAEAHGLADAIMRGVSVGLKRWLAERPLFLDCCPQRSLFVCPLFNLQRYAPGEGFWRWHCDWSLEPDATEPERRVLAWILYCNSLPEGGTEFHWQNHHVEAEKGKLAIFPAGLSHIHRGRVNHEHSKTIATGWINAGRLDDFVARLGTAG